MTREAQLAASLDRIRQAPRDGGIVELIVRRPGYGEREVLERAELDLQLGLVGDTWHVRPTKKTPDGTPHPGMQITLMNVRAIEAIAGERTHWPLAGDNFFVDLDLSGDNMPIGTRLSIGSAVVEVTEPPHTGCAKFTDRFGSEATRWLNTDEGRRLKLRGVHARVVSAGSVSQGDVVHVERPAAASDVQASTSSGSM